MKILGIDFGDARMGLSVSDENEKLAFCAGTYNVTGIPSAVKAAVDYIQKNSIGKIVIGLPLNMNGTEGPRCERTKKFAHELESATGLPIEMYDERSTTVLAASYMSATGTFGKKRKSVIDTLSAQIILQDYLDRKQNIK